MAAGKSTVAHLLAQRFDRGVWLEADVFRRSIVSGREEVTPELRPEAVEQLRLRYRIAAAAADAYFEADFTVVVEDVVAGPLLAETAALFRSRPLHVVVLLPDAETLSRRDAARRDGGYGAWSPQELHEGIASGTPRVGVWLDTSHQTPEETVDQILELTLDAPPASAAS